MASRYAVPGAAPPRHLGQGRRIYIFLIDICMLIMFQNSVLTASIRHANSVASFRAPLHDAECSFVFRVHHVVARI